MRWARIVMTIAVALPGFGATTAQAEKIDRGRPMNIEADTGRYDDAKQQGTFTGNVVVTKGSMVMRAAQIDVRQTPEGYQSGVMTGAGNKLASFRQKREGADEYIEGEAERIEYDGRADVIRFVNRAVVRRFRGNVLADESAGNIITYDNVAEVYTVVGGSAAATASNPTGRVRTVLTPRELPADAASAPKPAASDAGPR